MRTYSSTRCRRERFLETIIESPALIDAGQRWFNLDLDQLDQQQLREEAQRLRLRLLLTPRSERSSWPSTWIVQRLDALDALIRADRTSAAWSRARRR